MATACLATALGLLVPGCATPPEAIDAPPDSGLGSIHPAEGTVEALDLLPGKPGVEHWRALSGLMAPDAFEVRTAASADRPNSQCTQTADLETACWATSDDGSLVLEHVDSHPDRARSVFTPPLLLAPQSLPAGEPREVESEMRVLMLPNAVHERDHGRARRTIRYARDETIVWGGQEVRAKVVEVRFVADLRTAKADRSSELFIVPGEGVVAERWRETVTILKVFEKRADQTALREGAGLAASPAAGNGSSTEPASRRGQ